MNEAIFHMVAEYEFPGGKALQFVLEPLAAYSYVLISGSEALLIDPIRDVSAYRNALKQHGVDPIGVFLTHSHADFVAGHCEASLLWNIPIFIARAAHAGYPHQMLHDGATFAFGEITLHFLATPGHTLDSMCAIVESRGKRALVFTGDTLFVGGIGRPDLMGGDVAASQLAEYAYDSWNEKLARLSDDLRILPAHGAGSLCGAHLSDAPSSTIGEERAANPWLRPHSRSGFIARMLTGLAPAPRYFAWDAAMNRQGPEPVEWNAPVILESPDMTMADPGWGWIIDLRPDRDYAPEHIPGSLNIGLHGKLETWTGMLVPPESKIAVTADTPEAIGEAIRRLHHIGYCATGVLLPAWKRAGLPLCASELMSVSTLAELIAKEAEPLILDVRQPGEWEAVRIAGSLNLPLGELAKLSAKLHPDLPIAVICGSAYRSSIGVGILERAKFHHLSSVAGGMGGWLRAGSPVEGADAPNRA